MKVLKLATGHNADDGAETILMNILRGDLGRLQRGGSNNSNKNSGDDDELLPRVKPLKYSFEKVRGVFKYGRDIVMYAHFNKLNYFCTECIYSPNAYRMNARSFIKELERIRPRAILDIVRSGEQFKLKANVAEQILSKCVKCGYITSQKYCKACLLLYGLNNDDPTVGIARGVRKQNANKGGNRQNAYKEDNRQNAYKEDNRQNAYKI
uniref:Cytoplasmic tRNA 2-thiolation protein 1 C-terminal domain-containing protein n=1 Tax=Meloidogyne javanica TaxID=6303 RepID=A0A915LD43_MELJA